MNGIILIIIQTKAKKWEKQTINYPVQVRTFMFINIFKWGIQLFEVMTEALT